MWILVGVTLILFIYFGSQGDRFLDGDSYFYLKHSCEGTTFDDASVLFKYVVPLLGCNFWLIKLFYWLIFISTLIVASKIGEHFDPEHGYLVGFILFGFTFFTTEFFKFENDAIGYLFAFLGIYGALLFTKHKKIQYLISCIAFFAWGFFFWEGVAYWLALMTTYNILFLPFLLAGIFIFPNKFFIFLNSNSNVMEGQALIAIIYYGITMFCLFGILKTDRKTQAATILAMIPGIFYAKFYVIAVLFLSIVSFNGLNHVFKNKQNLATFVIFICVCMGFFWSINLDKSFPTQKDLALIKEVSPTIHQNSFGSGWIIEYYGGFPSSKSSFGGTNGYDYNLNDLVLLESIDFNSCPILKRADWLMYADCRHKT